MAFSIIPFFLLVMPIAEIAVFIVVGHYIGLLPTLALVVLTAIAGSMLLRVQGFGVLQRLREETAKGHVPGRELVHGVMIMIAGVLLLVPGFITDVLGILLFIPPIRDLAWSALKNRITVVSAGGFRPGRSASGRSRRSGPQAGQGGVIDLDSDDFERDPDPSSPWGGKNGSPRNGL